jgi:hypothetical protein
METLDPQRPSQWAKFLVLLLFLAAMAAGLGTLLGVILSHYGRLPAATEEAAKAERQGVVRLALICAVLLALTLIVMFWMIVRFVGSWFQAPLERSSTEHVDAWRLAGSRLKIPEDDDAEELPPAEDDEPPG